MKQPILITVLLFSLSLTPPSESTPPGTRSPQQRAHAALSATATAARQTTTYVSNLSSDRKTPRTQNTNVNQFSDCTSMMAHSTNRLYKAVQEMRLVQNVTSKDYFLHVSNVQTYVSSAMTDQDMCLQSLDSVESGVKVLVKSKVVAVRKRTSGALALVNKLNS